MKLLSLAASLALVLSACNASHDNSDKPRATSLTSDRERSSYLVGIDLAKQMQPLADEVDIDLVVQALRSANAHEKLLLGDAEIETARQQFTRRMREKHADDQKALAAKNVADGDALLKENAGKPGVQTTASGLQYLVLQDATGPKPNADDTVDVSWIVKRPDGFSLEDSYAAGHSTGFPLNRVPPGVAEAIERMPMSAKYRFWIPGRLLYGEDGRGGDIGPNQLLIYDIELLAIAGQPGGHPVED
ncbi:MAG TPA: FKBP-type peptidyl-prolyl cis-trans isomerase N-terminal domain-containing protein [Dokdonella sp.]